MELRRVGVGRPQPDEYSPYHIGYISLIESPDVLAVLRDQGQQTLATLAQFREPEGDYRYAPGKWTVKEVVGHMNDSERIFVYRALRIARGDRTPLAGFEQDDYVRGGGFEARRLADLIEEFSVIRKATLWLFEGLDTAAWSRRGIANNHEISVRALAYITAGHELHHRGILQEKYVPSKLSA